MSNLAVFRRIVFAAVLAGLIAGLLLTAIQQWRVVPIILEAETYEKAASGQTAGASAKHATHEHHDGTTGAHDHPHALSQDAGHGHAHGPGNVHSHSHSSAQHGNATERTALTALVNISLAVGFGLLLAAAFSLRDKIPGWRAGLLWGLAGYVAFFVAPSVGLPPELPGAEAAPLAGRQTWWMLTVLASVIGLSLIAFAPRWAMKLGGAAVLAAPHLFGAPQPFIEGGLAPMELARNFVLATAVANAAFWLVLGALTGFFYRRSRLKRCSGVSQGDKPPCR